VRFGFMQTLKYGLTQDDRLKYIDDVSNGLNCNCRCPACLEKLVAKQGEELDWHFAHYNSEMCTHPHPNETVLHKLAKQIILDAKKIWLPKISLGLVIPSATILIRNASYHQVKNAFAECKVDDIRPDVILEIGDTRLIVELLVTHAVDEVKREKIKRLDISAIEIDLRNTDIDDKVLEKILLEESERKRWLYSKLAVEKSKEYLQECIELQYDELSYVDCPILIRNIYRECSNANYQIDCTSCPFLLGYDNDNGIVLCLGEKLIANADDLKLDIQERRKRYWKLRQELQTSALERIRDDFMNDADWNEYEDTLSELPSYYRTFDNLNIKLIGFEAQYGVTIKQNGKDVRGSPKWGAGHTSDEAKLKAFDMICSL